MKKAKRNILIATVLVFVCAAVYLNWSYNRADESEPVGAEDGAGDQQSVSAGNEDSDYFAQARLTRQTSRDEALSLLETAAASESASQETIDGAMDAIAAMAGLSAASVAQITETIIGETGCTAEDIRVIEVKGGSSGTSITDTDETDAGAKASPSPSASPAPSPSASPAAE